MKFLIEEKGCDPMYNNGKCPTPYSTACGAGHKKLVKYLTEERHCDPLRRDAKGFSAFNFAVVAGASVDILKYFVEERRCNLEANDEYDLTVLSAIEKGNLEAVNYLSSIRTSSRSKLYGKFSYLCLI